MERIIILIGGAVIFLGMIFSFFNAVTTNPAAFVIVFLLGFGVIAYFFSKVMEFGIPTTTATRLSRAF